MYFCPFRHTVSRIKRLKISLCFYGGHGIAPTVSLFHFYTMIILRGGTKMRYSQLLIVLMSIAWVFLPLTQTNRILYLGLIAIYLALHNLVGYLWVRQGKIALKKYAQINKRMGERWGPTVYLILFVFFPAALGLYVALSSLMLKVM